MNPDRVLSVSTSAHDSMTTENTEFPESLAKELVSLADQMRALAPWDWFEEKLIFAVEDPETGWPVAVSIPGEQDEVLGLSFYMGVLGIDFLVRLRSDFFGQDAGRDAMMRLHSYGLEFDEPRYIEAEDKALLSLAGSDVDQSDSAYPVFRCAAPGELPWFLEAGDGQNFLRILKVCVAALEAASAAPEMIRFDYFGLYEADNPESNKLLDEEITADKVIDFMHENAMDLDFAVGRMLDEQTIENFPIWRPVDDFGVFYRETFEVRDLPQPTMQFPDLTRRALERLMKSGGKGTWEIGRRLGVPVGQPGSRYHHTEILAIRDVADGRILATEVGKVAERSSLLGRMLKRSIFDADTLPSKLRSDDEELLVLIDGFGQEFGIAIEGDECPALDKQLDELVQRMLGEQG